MRSRSAGWIFLQCALLATAFSGAQTPAHNPSDSAEQFDGIFRASRDVGVKEAYLERLFRSSHAANLVKLNNGDLLCFWFSGTAEGESNVAIVESRLAKGSERWGKPVVIDHKDWQVVPESSGVSSSQRTSLVTSYIPARRTRAGERRSLVSHLERCREKLDNTAAVVSKPWLVHPAASDSAERNRMDASDVLHARPQHHRRRGIGLFRGGDH